MYQENEVTNNLIYVKTGFGTKYPTMVDMP